MNRIKWSRLIFTFAILIALSFGLAYLIQSINTRLQIPLDEFAWLTYLIVFITTLICNITIIVPIPIAIAIMIAAATIWNPLLTALSASIGGAIGELSGYYAGYLGKKLAISDGMVWYDTIVRWMNKYGLWAVFFLALQPVLPFDIAGLVAGASKLSLRKFLVVLWVAKFIKYSLLVYSAIGIIKWLPLPP